MLGVVCLWETSRKLTRTTWGQVDSVGQLWQMASASKEPIFFYLPNFTHRSARRSHEQRGKELGHHDYEKERQKTLRHNYAYQEKKTFSGKQTFVLMENVDEKKKTFLSPKIVLCLCDLLSYKAWAFHQSLHFNWKQKWWTCMHSIYFCLTRDKAG